MKKKLLRILTIPLLLNVLLQGQLKVMSEHYEIVTVSSPGKETEMVAAWVGAGSVVVNDIPDGVLAYGNPCKIIRKL